MLYFVKITIYCNIADPTTISNVEGKLGKEGASGDGDGYEGVSVESLEGQVEVAEELHDEYVEGADQKVKHATGI